MTYDATGMERVPFDARYPRAFRPPTRRTIAGHGPRCSSNPEIGCVCGEDDRANEAAPADPGTIPATYLAEGDMVRLMGGTVKVVSVELLADGETRIVHRTDFANGGHLLCSQTVPAGFQVEVVG